MKEEKLTDIFIQYPQLKPVTLHFNEKKVGSIILTKGDLKELIRTKRRPSIVHLSSSQLREAAA